VKSAEETKGKVDAELKDLEKTLQNIESARPFEDLTVVCIGLAVMGMSRDGIWANRVFRTKLWLRARTSTSVLLSLCPRAAGKFPATRRSSAISPCCRWAFAGCAIRDTCRYALLKPSASFLWHHDS